MNGYERTVKFVRGEPVDRPPFMPLAIEWISREQGIPYPEFIYEPETRIRAYRSAVTKYDFDCVLPDADFYEQLEDFGAKPERSCSCPGRSSAATFPPRPTC